MADGSSSRASLTVLAVLAVLWAAYFAGVFLAPLTLAFFLVALTWPIQSALQARLPKIVATLITMTLLFVGILVMCTVILWALDSIWRTISSGAYRYQSLYQNMTNWLDQHGIIAASLWAETFNVNWVIGIGRQLISRTSQTMSFWAIVIAYVLTLLVEARNIGRSIEQNTSPRVARMVRTGIAETARKLRMYMGVRAMISFATGLMIAVIAFALGLPLAVEWGVLGFVLNFIPLIGPLVATILPATFAFAHIGDPGLAVVLFGGLTVLQFAGGNYIEPKIAGGTLRLSPFVVLVAVFLWTFIWGIYGTFIGVPIAITVACFAAQSPSSRWLLGFMGATDTTSEPMTPETETSFP